MIMARICNLHLALLFLACFIGAFQFHSAYGAPAAAQKFLTRIARNAIIDDHLPHSFIPRISRSSSIAELALTSARVKRSPTSKALKDPSSCITKCWEKDSEAAEKISSSLEGKVHSTDSLDEDPSAQEAMVSKVRKNEASLMSDSCKASKQTKSCLNACPKSDYKDIAVADYYSDEVSCEPDKHGGFTNYKKDVGCIQAVEFKNRDKCGKCGDMKDLREVCQLGLDQQGTDYEAGGGELDEGETDDPVGGSIAYEGDKSKNTNAIKEQCKCRACLRDCNKDDIKAQCGDQALDFYIRQLKIEPKSTLFILQKIQAITSVPSECSSFK